MMDLASFIVGQLNLSGVVENVNEKHLKPWSDLCKEAGIENTPLSPYLDQELLYNNSLMIDGSAIEATGFAYEVPEVRLHLCCASQSLIASFLGHGATLARAN